MQLNPLTFVFEIVNFVVLLFVLHRLVFRPLKKGIEARREETRARAEEVASRLEEAEALRRAVDEERKGLVEVRARAVREAAEQAAEERARILVQAREDAAAERARGARMLESERETMEAWLREITVERSTAMAGRMLLALAPHAVEDALRARLVEEIGRPGQVRVPEGANGPVEVELRCAKLPDDAGMEALRGALAAALGEPPRISVREDDSLVAGIVVRVGDRVLDASIAGQLEAFRDRARALLAEEPRG